MAGFPVRNTHCHPATFMGSRYLPSMVFVGIFRLPFTTLALLASVARYHSSAIPDERLADYNAIPSPSMTVFSFLYFHVPPWRRLNPESCIP